MKCIRCIPSAPRMQHVIGDNFWLYPDSALIITHDGHLFRCQHRADAAYMVHSIRDSVAHGGRCIVLPVLETEFVGLLCTYETPAGILESDAFHLLPVTLHTIVTVQRFIRNRCSRRVRRRCT